MMVCPVCKTKVESENQEYCLNCAWEFEYFFDELSEDEKKKYIHRSELYSSIYHRSNNTEYIKELENQIIELKKEQIIKLKDKKNIKEARKEIAPDKTKDTFVKKTTKIEEEIVTIR